MQGLRTKLQQRNLEKRGEMNPTNIGETVVSFWSWHLMLSVLLLRWHHLMLPCFVLYGRKEMSE